MKIRHQLLLTHGLLVFLALSVVIINVVSFKDMESDASIINQAGKLRMLSYSMAQLSRQITVQRNPDDNMGLIPKLSSEIGEFDEILRMLSGSSNDVDSIISHKQTVGRLTAVGIEWQEIFKPAFLNILENGSDFDSNEIINNEIDAFVDSINEMVTSYSAYAKSKVTRALTINEGLVIVIIFVTLYSFAFTSKRIGRPMYVLMQELKELSPVDDADPDKPRAVTKNEIAEMSQYFNEMIFDQLTKVFNRKAGLAKLDHMLQSDSVGYYKLSLCFVDINGLKDVNDQLGHKFGDELISSVVDCIRKEIREKDFIIRMGGDEFLIVLIGADGHAAEKVWDGVIQSYDKIIVIGQRRYIISVSHGIADFEGPDMPDVELLIKTADDRMYTEKKHIKDELKVKIIKSKM